MIRGMDEADANWNGESAQPVLAAMQASRTDLRGDRQLKRLALAGRFVARLVGWATGIAESDLVAASRGLGEAARARQIAMYLLHTSLSISYGDVALAIGRDRTTVSHACRLVEDLRDDGEIDALICSLEAILQPVAPLFGLDREV